MMRDVLCLVFGILLGANLNNRNPPSSHTNVIISPDVIESNGTYLYVLKMKTQEFPSRENVYSLPPAKVATDHESHNEALEPCWPDDFNRSVETQKKQYNTSTTGYIPREFQTQPSTVPPIYMGINDNVQKTVPPKMNIIENENVSKVLLPTVESQDITPLPEKRSTISADEWDPLSFYLLLQDLFQSIPDKYRDVTMLAVSLILPFVFLISCGGLFQSRQIHKLTGGQSSILIYTQKLLTIIQDTQKDQTKLLLLMNHKSGIFNEDVHNVKLDLLTFKDEIYSKEKNESENILFKFIEMENKMGGMCNSFVRWCLRNESQTADVKKKLHYMNMAQNMLHSNYKLLEKGLHINDALRSSGDTAYNSGTQGYFLMENQEPHQIHSITPLSSHDIPIGHSKSIWSGGKWFRQSGSRTANLYSPELTRKRSYTEVPDRKDIPDASPDNSMSTVSCSSNIST